jgi:phosphohistidine phosphatase
MELFLVRHGQAVPTAEDSSRPLSEPGAEAVEQVAALVARAGVRVDEIRHSGKLRAGQTADILAGALGPPQGVIAAKGLDPESDVHALAESLQREEGRLMLVGHLPFLGRLTGLLVACDPDLPVVRFHTATIARLVRERGAWSVDWVMTSEFARQRV